MKYLLIISLVFQLKSCDDRTVQNTLVRTDEMGIYMFGLVDMNKNRKLDIGDAFFLNDEYKAGALKHSKWYDFRPQIVYIHPLIDIVWGNDGSLQAIVISMYSAYVLLDYEKDGLWDDRFEWDFNNEETINRIFNQYEGVTELKREKFD